MVGRDYELSHMRISEASPGFDSNDVGDVGEGP